LLESCRREVTGPAELLLTNAKVIESPTPWGAAKHAASKAATFLFLSQSSILGVPMKFPTHAMSSRAIRPEPARIIRQVVL
jgi:hypothetical protein